MSSPLDRIEKKILADSFDDVRRPGEVLKDFLINQDLKQEAAAESLGITRQYLNRLLNAEDFRLTGDLIMKVAGLTRRSADYWRHLEDDWQNSRAGKEVGEQHSVERFEEGLSAMGVTQLVDFQIRKALTEKSLEIIGFKKPNLQGASYDLTIGEVDPLDVDLHRGEEGEYWLEPGDSALVSTAESLRLSDRMLGRLGPMMKLAHRGLNLITGPQIDPGFEGHISVAITNLSKRNRFLRVGESFLTVDFYLLRFPPEKKWTANRVEEPDREAIEANFTGNHGLGGEVAKPSPDVDEGYLRKIEREMSIKGHPELTFITRIRRVEEELEIEGAKGSVKERLAKIREVYG